MNKDSKNTIKKAINAKKEAKKQAMKDISERENINYANKPNLFEQLQNIGNLTVCIGL